MKATILAGAIAALTYGSAALAEDCPPQKSQAQVGQSDALKQQGVGGSGDVGMDDSSLQSDQALQNDQSYGGSSQAGIDVRQGEVLLRCTPAPSSQGIGGSGLSSGSQVLPPSDESYRSEQAWRHEEKKQEKEEKGTGGAGLREEEGHDMRGLTVTVGGGVEGYTNALAPQLNPGPAVSVTAALRPSKVLGIELGYTGAALNIDSGRAGGVTSGPDIVRNGGQAVATLGLGANNIQPYVLGGIGMSRYNVRAGFSEGFRDDTVGTVPVGAGLRTQFGDFTADARLNYNFLFDQEFASGVPASSLGAPGDTNFSKGGSYLGTVNLGLTF